ncbi:MAG: hypothetical protein ACK49I_09120, partial [Verrucomicrobiota bacterium]
TSLPLRYSLSIPPHPLRNQPKRTRPQGPAKSINKPDKKLATKRRPLYYLQQTLIAVAFAGLISSTLAGIGGGIGRLLEHPAIQHVGRLSFGLYLFHSAAPLLLGRTLPHLWHPFFHGPWVSVRILAFGLTSWGLAWLCWRYLEGGKRV